VSDGSINFFDAVSHQYLRSFADRVTRVNHVVDNYRVVCHVTDHTVPVRYGNQINKQCVILSIQQNNIELIETISIFGCKLQVKNEREGLA
jgi:hypothetical protein